MAIYWNFLKKLLKSLIFFNFENWLIRVIFPQNPLNVLKPYFSSCKKRKFVKIKNNGLNIVRKNGC